MKPFEQTNWRPGEPTEPGHKVLTPAELTERLYYLERLSANPSLDNVPMAQLQRKLETAWLPDPAVLLPAGGINGDLIERITVNTLPLDAGYAAYQPGAGNWAEGTYVKTVQGMVFIQGLLIYTPAAAPAGTTIATLPVGFRPYDGKQHMFLSWGQTGPGRLDVNGAGQIINRSNNGGPSGTVGGGTYLSLDNIVFYAGV